VCVTGALRTTPTEALNVLLNILPIDVQVRYVAVSSAFRLSETKSWNARPYGHGNILESTAGATSSVTDFMTTKLDLGRRAEAVFPTRKDWETKNHPEGFDTVIYTDGSKMERGVGAGVYSDTLGVAESYRLPGKSSIFQAEVLAILKACEIANTNPHTGRQVAIATDSQAAIRALVSSTVSSKLVNECRDKLEGAGANHRITLLWVPGHRDIEGNEKADELAKRGSGLDSSTEELVYVPMNIAKRVVFTQFLLRASSRWKNSTKGKIAQKTWPTFDRNRIDELIRMTRKNVARVVAVYTGHWPIGTHASKMGIPFNESCRSCGDAQERETPLHFLCKCPALAGQRYKFLGKHFLHNLDEIAERRAGEVLNFLNSTGWI